MCSWVSKSQYLVANDSVWKTATGFSLNKVGFVSGRDWFALHVHISRVMSVHLCGRSMAVVRRIPCARRYFSSLFL